MPRTPSASSKCSVDGRNCFRNQESFLSSIRQIDSPNSLLYVWGLPQFSLPSLPTLFPFYPTILQVFHMPDDFHDSLLDCPISSLLLMLDVLSLLLYIQHELGRHGEACLIFFWLSPLYPTKGPIVWRFDHRSYWIDWGSCRLLGVIQQKDSGWLAWDSGLTGMFTVLSHCVLCRAVDWCDMRICDYRNIPPSNSSKGCYLKHRILPGIILWGLGTQRWQYVLQICSRGAPYWPGSHDYSFTMGFHTMRASCFPLAAISYAGCGRGSSRGRPRCTMNLALFI